MERVPLTKTWTKDQLEDIRRFACSKKGFEPEVSNGLYWWLTSRKGESFGAYWDDEVLYCAFEDLPLFINSKDDLSQYIIQWRLEHGE
jgi:hypothetical protein